MIKRILEYFIRLKNPAFSFGNGVTNVLLISLAWLKLHALIRGNLKLIMHLKKPALLFLGKQVTFFNAVQIKTGSYVQVGDYSHLSALGHNGLTIGNNTAIGAFSRLVVSTSFNHIGQHIHIGNNVGIGEYAYLGGGGGLDIGNDCIIGQYFSCHPENHTSGTNASLIRQNGVTRKGIQIGNNCWIGARVTILDGVSIGEGCIVAAGSVVTRSFPSYSTIGGIPAGLLNKKTASPSVSETVQLSDNQTLFL